MSNGYGIDIYGVDTYGYSQSADYSVNPFIASQTGYGEITLTWASPNIKSWKLLHLVRSTYGYPSTAEDGVFLLEITPSTIVRTYDDPGLSSGTIYYYAMFLTVEAPTWGVSTTYAKSTQVLYNGLYWNSLQTNTGQTPFPGSAYWAATSYVPTWLPAGYTATLSLGNEGYSTRLYDRTPQPYKITTSDTFSNIDVDNPSLQNYLSLFGFGLDILKTSYDSYLNLNDADTVSATSLDILGQQLGINTNYLSTPQQRRQRIKNASINYRMKGQTQSIHNIIAELTGWDSEITYGPNMFNSPDQTAFVHPKYDVWNVNTTYFPNNLIQYNGFNYKNLVQSVGQSQQPTGANSSNTWWQVQTQVLNTTTNLNPRTGKFSTWNAVGLSGTSASATGIMTGLPHPTDTTINNYNALSIVETNNFGLDSTLSVLSETPLTTPNYSASANYVINNYVLYTDGYYYRAAKPSGPATPYGAITPGTNQTFWKPFYYTTSDDPNIQKDGIPIPQPSIWDAAKQYAIGDIVQYRGIVYRASTGHKNQSPSGYYYSNIYWAALEPAQGTITTTSAWTRISNSVLDTASVRLYYRFYDKNGNRIKNNAPDYSGIFDGITCATARFTQDYKNLNGTTEPGLINAVGSLVSVNGTWASTPATANLWRTSYGMASVDQTLAGTTTYIYSVISGSASQGRFAVTLATPYNDENHKTHGIVFCMRNATNFYYVTRQSLRQVLGGVDTILASWPRIEGEARIVVDAAADIHVYQYARTGDGTLNLLGQSIGTGPSGNAQTGPLMGLIQKYSATGDL